LTLLRQKALWLATGRNGVLGFAGFQRLHYSKKQKGRELQARASTKVPPSTRAETQNEKPRPFMGASSSVSFQHVKLDGFW